ncbi:hypothetical protein O3G_MSEX014301 [Manduca sexta]|uniref:Uncharacterized protein n=1 Tax=Manduca sexta TaxID=7130 RepID=A0A921ZUH5_MANSE|nr:hypothetical protein O3G_MSEX014301 [Manduca sexta]
MSHGKRSGIPNTVIQDGVSTVYRYRLPSREQACLVIQSKSTEHRPPIKISRAVETLHPCSCNLYQVHPCRWRSDAALVVSDLHSRTVCPICHQFCELCAHCHFIYSVMSVPRPLK